MGKRISFKEKRKAAPEWVFSWRRPGNPALSKWIAVLVTGALFALLLTSVRIQVAPPVTWAAAKTSVIYVTDDDAQGRSLKLLAREGGPFPSRFMPATWDGAASLEQEVSKLARWDSPPYVPSLRDLPRQGPRPLQLAGTGEPVLPKRLPTAAAPLPVKLKPSPVIHPLSGISLDEMPRSLPSINAPIEPTITSETWRFLVRLDSAGHVRDCVSLAGGDQTGSSIMEAWLRRVTFHPDPDNPARWIAVGVGFTNQPEANGPDAH